MSKLKYGDVYVDATGLVFRVRAYAPRKSRCAQHHRVYLANCDYEKLNGRCVTANGKVYSSKYDIMFGGTTANYVRFLRDE